MSNRNGLISRMAFLFKGASTADLEDLANQVIRDEAGLDPSGALFKNDLQSALNGLTPLASADWQGTTDAVHAEAGPPQSASGSGAAKMVKDYFTPAQQSALVNLYQDLSDKLESQESVIKALISQHGEAIKALNAQIARAHALEKGCAALSKALIAVAKNERFPEFEAEDDNDATKDKKAESTVAEEEEDDSARAAKSTLPELSVRDLISAVNARSQTGRLAAPPSFGFAKANPAIDPDIDAALSFEDGVAVASYRQRAAAVAAGHADASILSNMRLSSTARAALGIAA